MPKKKIEEEPKVEKKPRQKKVKDEVTEQSKEEEVKVEPKVEPKVVCFEGQKVVSVLEEGHTQTHFLCKMDDGTTMHVPMSKFE